MLPYMAVASVEKFGSRRRQASLTRGGRSWGTMASAPFNSTYRAESQALPESGDADDAVDVSGAVLS